MYLKALKPFTYSTRRLQAGDIFEARKSIDARLLIAIRKAEEYRAPGKIAPPPARLQAQLAPAIAPSPLDHDRDGHIGGSKSPPPSDDLTALRGEYFTKVRKRPFNGWDADTLREKIAAAGDG